VIDVRVSGCSVRLSREEGWQLRTRLGDRAPFVRNQLMVAQQGGRGGVTLLTREERREVLDALSGDGEGGDALSRGLRALEAALVDLGGRSSGHQRRPAPVRPWREKR
jgi:hypothetical protein